ncbi:glucose dehydrogenase [FAD, quinone]-like [Cylas formicarius]|uniref:glucose dehydrogenase [FAD, quinone]-like n=1 Tax=Cylas formicarius TaxID=197179 RepID=UPI00295833E2|nr:glucose dehydrogenase [FAD, quinone]-like [Cylas formicarius]
MKFKALIILSFCFVHISCQNVNLTELIGMVQENLEAAQEYVLPTDNRDLVNVSDATLYDYGEFNYIVVGAGSAGAVLANRLSEVPNNHVLLLEAGGEQTEFTDILGLSPNLYFSDMNWGYNTTRQENACLGMVDQRCFYPRGKVVGGCSTINAGMYVRGSPLDFDRWETELGNKGWSYNSVLPYFLKSENAVFDAREKKFHGEGGYLHVDVPSGTPGLETVIFDGFEELGQKRIEDYNGEEQVGISRVQFTLNENKRDSTGRAFLDNVRNRSNLHVSTNSYAVKVMITKETKTAYGVVFIKDNKQYIARAKNEVILSGGAINSPQLLMLSGIGPKQHLESLGIEVIEDLPVGQNLEDHMIYTGLFYRTNHTFYNNTLEELLQLYMDDKRPYIAGFSCEFVTFVNFQNNTKDRPNVQILVSSPPNLNNNAGWVFKFNEAYTAAHQSDPLHDIWFTPLILHPKSKGSVTLQSNSPLDMPIIETNYLSDPDDHDIETLYNATQFILRLNETKAFRDFEATFMHPPMPTCDPVYDRYSKDWWYCSIRTIASTLYHPIATTRMGNSTENSVVDSELRVHGINGLRVIDAGVIPEHLSGLPNAAIIMVGEKGADLVLSAKSRSSGFNAQDSKVLKNIHRIRNKWRFI